MKFEHAHIKKGDLVEVLTGKDKGKTGKVLVVYSKRERVLVEKLNIVKRHMKPSQKYKQGGIIEKEASLHWSNLMVMCGKCNKAVRIKHKLIEDKNERTCGKCGELIGAVK
ncbi:MAG: 50S ribosomal protein L24 [Deltaproteobacteria bacterium RIFCSPLOWO2_02_FULL_47_10]|nr:MAG: 50S ribosomal protein L24 [Deltaproteobacteria bacterium RIFCSPLOWO2_02_FULL_47_10]